eukprot:scaffold22892_cov27-Tisochrysis_lutea.AAC.1
MARPVCRLGAHGCVAPRAACSIVRAATCAILGVRHTACSIVYAVMCATTCAIVCAWNYVCHVLLIPYTTCFIAALPQPCQTCATHRLFHCSFATTLPNSCHTPLVSLSVCHDCMRHLVAQIVPVHT